MGSSMHKMTTELNAETEGHRRRGRTLWDARMSFALVALLLLSNAATRIVYAEWSWLMVDHPVLDTPTASLPCNFALCMNLRGYNTTNSLISYRCQGIDFWNEQWKLRGSQLTMQTPDAQTLCLDVKEDNKTAGLSECVKDAASQQWSFIGSKVRNGRGAYLHLGVPLERFTVNKQPLLASEAPDAAAVTNFRLVPSSKLNNHIPASPAVATNLVRNGLFVDNWHEPRPYAGDMTYICEWTIPTSVNIVERNNPFDKTLRWTVRLGSIKQVVPTYKGEQHTLTFRAFLGENICGKTVRSILVMISNSSVPSTTIQVTKEGEWLQNIRFIALDKFVNLTFASLNEDDGLSCGPFIANIKMVVNPAELGPHHAEATKHPSAWNTGLWKLAAAAAAALCLFYVYCLTTRCVQTDYCTVHNLEAVPVNYWELGLRRASFNCCRDGPEIRAKRFQHKEILGLTSGFSSKIIGKGGSADVYLGESAGGYKVAIKRARKTHLQSAHQFHEEVIVLDRVHHRRLVHFLGYCDSHGEQILVFEYMEQGSLFDRLHKLSSLKPPLTFDERVKIILDVAQGIDYLHHGAKPSIIHCDVKSGNVLLSDSLAGVVTDFGVFMTGHEDTHKIPEPHRGYRRGTRGYMDPQMIQASEEGREVTISTKSDVYSFGVLVLEALTGWQAPDTIRDVLLSPERRRRVFDPQSRRLTADLLHAPLCADFDPEQLKLLLQVAERCVSVERDDRPSMDEVVAMLPRPRRAHRQPRLVSIVTPVTRFGGGAPAAPPPQGMTFATD